METSTDYQNALKFKDVTISIFDIHTAIDAIISGSQEYFQRGFSFLIDAERYRAAFAARVAPTIPSFKFLGLGRKTIRQSRFWSEFILIDHHANEPDCWKQQLPFVAHPNVDLVLLNPPDGVQAKVRCAIYLNALGWSTNVLIRLRGSLGSDQIIAILAKLKNRPETAPFVMSDKAATLTDVFRFFEDRMLREVYAPDRPPSPRMQYPRRFVTSLNTFVGPLKPYEAMSAAERGLFRGILYGKTYTANEELVAQDRKPRRLRRITISESGGEAENFGLADWDRGLLLFLQRDARIPQSLKKLRAVLCHAENCRAMLVTLESLLSFLSMYSLRRTGDGIGEELRVSVERTLQELPWRYRNQVCQFYSRERRISDPLRRYVASENNVVPIGPRHYSIGAQVNTVNNAEPPTTSFDTFLSHNSQDKLIVRQLADALAARGLRPWLDERELVPGRPWQEALEQIIQTTKTTAVMFGPAGLGPWEEPEMRACLCEFVNRKLPVIPVLLPGAPEQPNLPLFLKAFTWVDLRGGLNDDGLNRLVWGITGHKPISIPSAAGSAPKAPVTTQSDGGPVATWNEKLEYLLEQQAIIADPAQTLALKKQVEEAEQKIHELGE